MSLKGNLCPNCGSPEISETLACGSCGSQLSWDEGHQTLRIAGVTQTCSKCSAPNPADHEFCGRCGTPLRRACIVCGETHPVGTTHCPRRGVSLAEASQELNAVVRAVGSNNQDYVELNGDVLVVHVVPGCLGLPLDPQISRHRILDRDFNWNYSPKQGWVAIGGGGGGWMCPVPGLS